MLNTSKRFVSTVVDRDRVSVADVGKERFPYSKIPMDNVPIIGTCILEPHSETVYFLKAIANDRKRLFELYFKKWLDAVNGMLIQGKADFRVTGVITPDYRYKVMKMVPLNKMTEDRSEFAQAKQTMLNLLLKYQENGFANGNYTAIRDAAIQPSIQETVECPFGAYIGYIRSRNMLIVVPEHLFEQLFIRSDIVNYEAIIREAIEALRAELTADYNEKINRYGVDYRIDEAIETMIAQRPEIVTIEGGDTDG